MPRDTAADDATTDAEPTTAGAGADSHERPTIGSVSHTNPRTGEAFGDTQVFDRGRIAVVDGGATDSRSAEDGESEPMKEVDHTPREGAPDANEVYTRGGEPAGEAETGDADSEGRDEGADA